MLPPPHQTSLRLCFRLVWFVVLMPSLLLLVWPPHVLRYSPASHAVAAATAAADDDDGDSSTGGSGAGGSGAGDGAAPPPAQPEQQHHFWRVAEAEGVVYPARQRRLVRELRSLARELPLHWGSSVAVRMDEERPHLLKVLVITILKTNLWRADEREASGVVRLRTSRHASQFRRTRPS